MRMLLLLLLLATRALAVSPQTATQLLLPSWGGGLSSTAFANANTLYCATVVANFGGTFTKLAGLIPTGVGGATCGFAIYPDSNGGSSLGSASASCASSPTTISATSLSITIEEGTRYRICTCSTSTTPTYLSPGGGGGNSIRVAVLKNGFSANLVGTAANACTSGAPPSTTGALTGSSVVDEPYVYLE